MVNEIEDKSKDTKNDKKKKSIWYTILHIQTLNEEEYLHLIRRLTYFIGGGFAVSFLIFIILAYLGGLNKVINIVESANLTLYFLAFLAVFIGYLLRFVKWSYYLKKVGIKVPKRKSLVVYLSLYSMDLTPGKFGRVLAAYTLNRLTDKKITHLVPIVAMDIFTDFLGVGIVAIIVALYFHTFIIEIAIIDILLLIPYLFILNSWFYKIIKKYIKSKRFLKLFSIYGDEYFIAQSTLNTKKTYTISLLVSVPAAFMNASSLYFSLLAIHVKIAPEVLKTVFVSNSTLLFGMVTGVPGNLGVTDASLVTLVSTAFSLNLSLSSAATIMARFATLWFGVLLGGVFLIYSFRYWVNPKDKKKKVINRAISKIKESENEIKQTINEKANKNSKDD